ncbi:alcohol dehydrogenase catalytic domain-containing protein [Leptolyngbya sp. NK1-12]|uniref:alcohol dehydrogenase catalytic domain-containing protein n=1 Tax=Leptolyngbya sp. NK1-12 TaxID=2547451 RepID=UPI0029303D17
MSETIEQNRAIDLSYGLAALSQGNRLVPWTFERRKLRSTDIRVKIQFCGICHSDLHAIGGSSRFPLVPGHEIVGEVTAIGTDVTTFRIGDAVAVGTIVVPAVIAHHANASWNNIAWKG